MATKRREYLKFGATDKDGKRTTHSVDTRLCAKRHLVRVMVGGRMVYVDADDVPFRLPRSKP